MLVVSLRGVNCGCLVSLRVSRAKGQFLSHNAFINIFILGLHTKEKEKNKLYFSIFGIF